MAVADILISPATIWYAPVGEANPDDTTVIYGAAWGGNWVSLGYTLEPVSLSYETDTFKLMVQQLPTPVKGVRTSEDAAIETVLAEFTSTNLDIALQGSTTTTAAGAAQRALTSTAFGGQTALDEYAWGFEGLYKTAANLEFPVRFLFYKGSAVLNGALEFAKDSGVGIPLRIELWADTTQTVGEQFGTIEIVTAELTG